MSLFDLETTGVDVEEDRVVTGAVALVDPATRQPPVVHRWLADPGIEIPEGASAIHGVTTEYAREHGHLVSDVVEDITEMLATHLSQGIPVVGANLQYDLTLLDRECQRHGLATLAERLNGRVAPVIDVMVIDRAVDPYRKGGRKLSDLAPYYGVRLDAAHDSADDALAAGRIAWKLGHLGTNKPDGTPLDTSIEGRGRVIDVGAMSLAALHDAQVRWKAKQAEGLSRWLREKNDPGADGVRGEWPFIPSARTGELF